MLRLKEEEFTVDELVQWGRQCPMGEDSDKRKPERRCLRGPWMPDTSSLLGKGQSGCSMIHPYPMAFTQSVIMWPGIKYKLMVQFSWNGGCSNGGQSSDDRQRVETIVGFQGIPRIKTKNKHPNIFQWTEIYKRGLFSSVSSGQLPSVLYIM